MFHLVRAATLVILIVGLHVCGATAQAKSQREMVAEIMSWWAGQYDNYRQLNFDTSWRRPGTAITPEITQSGRRIVATVLDAPQLGDAVLYFEEYRDERPGIANRQRVTVLRWDDKTKRVRAVQHFFAPGLSYDRDSLGPDSIAKMTKDEFFFQPGCDLYFRWDEHNQRYMGGMLPRSCVYEHEVDGMVYAEFDMLLWPDQLWYRDRSRRVVNDTIRGEIDGFNWLRFEKRE